MLKRKSKLFIVSIVFGAIALIASGCLNDSSGGSSDGVSTETFTWRMVTHQEPGTARYDETIKPFVEAVEEASGGRLIIEPYGAGELFDVSDSIDQIDSGVVEMGAIWGGYWTNKDPVFAFAGQVPGEALQTLEEHNYRSEKVQPILEKAYEDHGVKFLGGFDLSKSSVIVSRDPIKSVDDFKGLKMRSGGIGAKYYSTLGASTVSLSPTEIYQALQSGTIDAAEYNDYLVDGEIGLDEIAKYAVDNTVHKTIYNDKDLIVNPEAWDSLPDDLKEIVLIARDRVRYLSEISYGVGNSKAKQEWIDNGIEIVEFDDDEYEKMQEAAYKFDKEYAEEHGGYTQEYLETYIEVLEDLGYTEEAEKLK